jgi:hypothetical protein
VLSRLILDANNLYWIAYSATHNSAVNQQPRLGGSTTSFVDVSASSTTTTINSIKTDGTTHCWSQAQGGGNERLLLGLLSTVKIQKVSVNSGASRFVTSLSTSSNVGVLKVVNSCPYWRQSGTIKSIAVNP